MADDSAVSRKCAFPKAAVPQLDENANLKSAFNAPGRLITNLPLGVTTLQLRPCDPAGSRPLREPNLNIPPSSVQQGFGCGGYTLNQVEARCRRPALGVL